MGQKERCQGSGARFQVSGFRCQGPARIEVGGSLRFDFAHLRLRLEAKSRGQRSEVGGQKAAIRLGTRN